MTGGVSGATPRITIDHASYRYPRGHRDAVHDVECAIYDGVTGLLGVNGAGKSTLMALLATSLVPSSGNIEWGAAGPSVAQVRKSLSWVPQSAPVPRMFTVEEFLEYSCFLKGVPKQSRPDRLKEALDAVGLADQRSQKCGALSGGQARRLVIAWGLLERPEVLLLDEPTAGLDIYQRRAVRELIKGGLAPLVLISSHILSDILGVADRLLVLDAGHLVFDDTVDAAKRTMASVTTSDDPEEQLMALLDAKRGATA